jgi:hypothetical protein
VFGPPLKLPADLDRPALESYRHWFEELLNWLTEEAESWAAGGRRRPGEVPMLPGEAPWGLEALGRASHLSLPEGLARSWAELADRRPGPSATAAGPGDRAA